jgi:pyridoxal phosphate enzyme (YggS family)
MMDHAQVAQRAEIVRERIRRAGGVDVGILAVTKGFGTDAIAAAVAAGLTRIGENYAQEAVPKVLEAASQGIQPEVHFIGHLQSNKVRMLAEVVDVWQSVDRPSVIGELVHRVPGARVFIQVNATAEPGKGGCPPDDVDALVAQARAGGLVVEGLMTIGPTDEDPARTRRVFAATRAAVDRLGLGQCSMGMSGDLEIAVAEGSTMVRVGTALFGPRSYAP